MTAKRPWLELATSKRRFHSAIYGEVEVPAQFGDPFDDPAILDTVFDQAEHDQWIEDRRAGVTVEK